MNEITAVRALLSDAFGRVAEQVDHIASDLSDGDAGWRPDPGANSVAWLLWHLSRVQDDHVADLAGAPQVWTSQGFADRFALPFEDDATGYGQDDEQVGQVRASGRELAGYHAAVHEATLRYLDSLTLEELDRVVDTRWDPPVTVAVRLVSVIDDCAQHVGQAAYVRGLAQRRSDDSSRPT